jgi:hypothetical protein
MSELPKPETTDSLILLVVRSRQPVFSSKPSRRPVLATLGLRWSQ